jgi:prepilin-type N-terminal cleavage/methylation domain-containing protein
MISKDLFHEGETPMKNNKGFTLIELAVVLAIIAVLAAILTPIVTNYIDQARVARAFGDTRTIADAIRLYKRDVGYYPIYPSLASAKANINFPNQLVGTGSSVTGTGWVFTNTSDLVTILNTNVLGLSTASQVTNPGRAAYRGPYIGALDTDPWGNRYTVTAANLAGTTNRGFVISAGPNGTLDTDPTAVGMTTFTVGSDDIAAPIN